LENELEKLDLYLGDNRHAAIGELLRNQIEAGATLGSRVAYFDNIPAAEEWLCSN